MGERGRPFLGSPDEPLWLGIFGRGPLHTWYKYGYYLGQIGGNMATKKSSGNIKRENFIRLAESRVTRAIESLRIIGNLSNRSNYEYDEEDVKKIINTLQDELTSLKNQFKIRSTSTPKNFRLK